MEAVCQSWIFFFFYRRREHGGVTEVIYSKILLQTLDCAFAQTIYYLGNYCEQLDLF